jgi:hypothetical protein
MPEKSPAPGAPFPCPNCGASDWKADYYEAVWQTVSLTVGADGEPELGDYLGVTGTYDDPSTEDEFYRCCSCDFVIPLEPVLVGHDASEAARAVLEAETTGEDWVVGGGVAAARALALARLILGESEPADAPTS